MRGITEWVRGVILAGIDSVMRPKPDRIEAKYVMRSAFEWDRFMRFMERYAEDNELGFNKKD